MSLRKKSSSARSASTVSNSTVNEVDEVVRQRTHVPVAQLVVTQRLLGQRAHEPHEATADHHVDTVATNLRGARQKPCRESCDRRFAGSRHARDDHAT